MVPIFVTLLPIFDPAQQVTLSVLCEIVTCFRRSAAPNREAFSSDNTCLSIDSSTGFVIRRVRDFSLVTHGN